MTKTLDTDRPEKEPSQKAIDTFAQFGGVLTKHTQDERERILRALAVLFEVKL